MGKFDSYRRDGRRMIRTRIEHLCYKYDCEPRDLKKNFNFFGKFKQELDKLIYENKLN